MQNFKMDLTNLDINDLNAILAGLGKLPIEAGLATFGKVKTECDAKIKAFQEANQPLQGQDTK